LGLFGSLGEQEVGAEVRNLGMVDVNIAGGDDVGGLAGISRYASVAQCYSTGSVSGKGYLGGLVGEKGGVMTSCYSMATILGDRTGQSYGGGIGGLVGENHGTMTHCYSIGSVMCDGPDKTSRGVPVVGGLAGRNSMFANSWAIATNCFWDVETSGRITSEGGTGKTTAEMQTAGTFLTWGTCSNEGVWTINDGNDYPRLQWENKPGALIGVAPLSDFLTGTGTENDPFLIYEAEELNLVGLFPCEWDKQFKLMADVDMSGFDGRDGKPPFNTIAPGHVAGFEEMLAFRGTAFTGLFDGNGYTISRLTVETHECGGLFGGLGSGGEIRNLGVVDVNMIGSFCVGGLVGFSEEGSSVTHCHSTGTVSGWYAGGLVGRNSGNINTSNSTCTLSGTGWRVGGLVGDNAGTITTSYSAGTSSGDIGVGGFVGVNHGSITASYCIGSGNGHNYVGGLVGVNRGNITASYSTGTVNGDTYVGGLVGLTEWDSSVTQCYSSSTVTGDRWIGGLVGSKGEGPGVVLHSVWDVDTSGQASSAGGVGLTTAEMTDFYVLGLNGFANDPNWILDAGRDYPRLAWEGTAGQIIPEPIIDWLDGQGTQEDPHRIDTAEQLILLSRASTLWDEHFILGADIDLDPNLQGRQVFSQAVIQVFSGTFDGNGHTISHLTITGESHLGLFGELASGAIISNLGLEAVDVNGTGDWVGGLAGSNSDGSITNSYSTGTVSGHFLVGGLVGRNWGHTAASHSTVTVNATGWIVGGLAGSNGGSIANSYSTGTVNGKGWEVGGLVGSNVGRIANSYSTGRVTGDRSLGGLVGSEGAYGGEVSHSFWDVETSGLATSAGGTGKTTAEMEAATTFLDAGWDFAGETANGTDDIWWILEGQDYPRLWWEADN